MPTGRSPDSRSGASLKESGVTARFAAIALLAIAALSACAAPTTGSAQKPAADVLVVAADGTGTSCSSAQPCTLAGALGKAAAGQTISVLDGTYGDLVLDATAVPTLAKGIVVEPARSAKPVFGKLELDLPSITWRNLDFNGAVYLNTGADGTHLDGIHVDGSGVFVHADAVVISGAVIENGTSIDGIQVGGAHDLLIEKSIVRAFGQGAGSDVHSDCVQLFDSSNIVIRGNYFGACDNAALIFSPGKGEGIKSVLVESNFLQGCVEKTERCSQGTALDLREPTAADVVVRNNTMLDGSVMVQPIAGLVFDRNIVGFASNCDMPMTNSIVENWNKGKCAQPTAVGKDGNRTGTVDVVDRAGGNLRLVNPDQATIQPSGQGEPAKRGFDGSRLTPQMAGAGG
jgi:hypothetical protein